MRIHQLSPAIANQIAAGEVIERPASVVKELLENSLDAGADAIVIEIGYGGLNQIKVSDNGQGIIAEDLPLAIAAHATSKITTLDDLYAIDSMGFRGEALASIASISKLVISSKTASQEHAMMLQVCEGRSVLSPCARNVGTTIDVVDLFYNTPVRKRFLKSEKLEFQAIELVVKRFALSAPQIHVTLKHNNKPVLSLPSALNEPGRQTRMTKIFGASFVKEAIYLDVEHGTMRLSGWISGSGYQRSQNDRQWIYINQRMVKDKLLNHALKQAYDGMLYPGRFPACLLYFNLDAAEVDVNVHPTKHEVRFQQPRLIHDFLTSQLGQALQSNKNTIAAYPYNSYSLPQKLTTLNEPPCYSHNSELDKPFQTVSHCEPIEYHALQRPLTPIKKSALSGRDETVKFNVLPVLDEWIILNKQYILIFMEQQPYLVDMVKVQQQWLFEQLKPLGLPLESRPLLVPISYPVAPLLKEKITEVVQCLGQLGVQSEWLDKENQWLIRSIPLKIPYLDLRLFIEKLAEIESIDVESLLELMGKTQGFDLNLLSSEERMECSQFLQKVRHQNEFCKVLSIHDCRMLLHA